MKCTIVLLLLWGFTSAIAQDADELLGIEQRRSDAIIAKSQESLSALYDETYHGVTAAGKSIDKPQFLEMMKSNNPPRSIQY